MITGFLGTEEVLVHCNDNGDVVAYYTKDIANAVLNKTPDQKTQGLSSTGKRGLRESKKRMPKVQPFFTSNVLMTAWGLVIHRDSRLIAVSSNRAEVTVFAFALTPDEPSKTWEKPFKEPKDNVEAWVRQRRRNWKVIISLPEIADNIPNICFLESKDGLAEKVVAVDIKGTVWVADIWTPFQAVTGIPASKDADFVSEEFFDDASR